MKTTLTHFALVLTLGVSVFAQERTRDVSNFTPAELTQRTLQRRETEAVLWGMPAVNHNMMLQAMVRDIKAGPGSNELVYWSHPCDWKNQTLTPNPTPFT
ncbi:MAG TPA: hypothetical protein VGI60_05065 [Chthoniobacterales bacterium]|jgi:hypothetical protein